MNRLLTIVDSKYQRLEYIESSGTQYINTNYFLQSNNLKVNIKFEFDFDTSTERDLIGNQDSATNRFIVGTFSHYIFGYSRNSSGQDSNVITANFSGKQIIELEANYDYTNSTKTLVANGVTTTNSYVRSIYPSNNNIQIFGAGTGQSGTFVGKIYYCKIYDNGVLVRNFVPVLRKTDNELGMLDLVEGKFYPNAGTGKFTANLDTMYAIIQGSPTQSPYGVFSGFSSGFSRGNYLKTASIPSTATKIELSVIATVTDLTTWQSIVRLTNNVNRCLEINGGNGLLRYLYENTEGTSSGINLATVTENMPFTFRLIAEGTNLTCKLIQNGIELSSVTVTDNKLSSMYYNLLLGYVGKDVFLGTIDLNRSYIKLGSTKYKLQAVVGYTKVGSPTITDGVVSGFSSANYLRTSQNVNILSTANSWEIQTAFSVSDLTNSPQMIMGNAYGTANGILFAVFKDTDNTYTLRLYTYNNGAMFTALPTTKFNTLTKYYARIVFTGQQYKLLVSNDKINWNEIYSNNIDTNIGISNQYLFFGVDTRGNWSAFTGGQLYISETIIYQNHKLWFNGQEA